MSRDRSRRTEGSLLLFTLVIVASGMILAFLAKMPALPADSLNLNTATVDELAIALELDPELAQRLVRHRERLGGFEFVQQIGSLPVFVGKEETQPVRAALAKSGVDVNTETAETLRKRLELPRGVARRITEYRDSLPNAAFRKPEALLRTPIVDARTLTQSESRFVVRHPARAFLHAVLWTALTAFLILFVPIVLRRAGAGGDPFLLPVSLLLAGLGVITLFSIKDPLRDTEVYAHHAFGMVIGCAALVMGALLPVRLRRNMRRYTYVWAIAAVGLLVLLMAFGAGPEGVRLSVFGVQPVEVIKLLLVFFVAGYLADRGDLLAEALHRWRPPMLKGRLAKTGIAWPRWQDLGPVIGMYAVALVLFLVVKDMGPALLLFGAFIATMYIVTGRSGLAVIGLGMMLFGGIVAYYAHVGVLPVRVNMWRSPWNNPHPMGMQLGQSLWAMGSGGIWGTGLGLGSPQEMPRSGSDLVFSSVAEQLGLIGSLAVLLLFMVLVWRGLRIARETQNDFDRILAIGLTTLLGAQVFLIVAGVTGLLPLTGITLPFVAYGNSSLVADLFLIGLLRGISAPTGSVAVGATKPLLQRTIRQFGIAYALATLGLIGIGRLVWVQGITADDIAGRFIHTPDADGQQRDKINPRLLALERRIERGSIYDRTGKVLATSRLEEISREVEDPQKARAIFRRGRYYPRGADFAHLVGYLDPFIGGPAGMEQQFDGELRGFSRYSELLADYRVKDLPGWLAGNRKRMGRDVFLTVDADVQRSAMKILKERVGALRDDRTGKRKSKAAMVVMDPITGEVLASASIPTYDPNALSPAKFRELKLDSDQAHRLIDRSRVGYYPPGSTMKVATAGAALEEGVDFEYDCAHVAKDLRWSYGGRFYGRKQLLDDRGDPPHNHLKMPEAMRVSCNLYFANLGIRLGAPALWKSFSGSDRWSFKAVRPLPEFASALPVNAFGQGNMIVTPTEMARVAAAVANRGSMMEPTYWREVRERDHTVVRKNVATVMSKPLHPDNAAQLSEMMRGVVTRGTARGVFDGLPIEVAGKTGTAQTDEGDKEPHSWFIGFAPLSRPQYAFACVIENGGYGKRGAAPAIRSLLETIFH